MPIYLKVREIKRLSKVEKLKVVSKKIKSKL
uniref:Uncharacterized protein n=1 Tax=Ciona intestinalis TaxID=7719 RepID=H2Y1V6_CIOIN